MLWFKTTLFLRWFINMCFNIYSDQTEIQMAEKTNTIGQCVQPESCNNSIRNVKDQTWSLFWLCTEQKPIRLLGESGMTRGVLNECIMSNTLQWCTFTQLCSFTPVSSKIKLDSVPGYSAILVVILAMTLCLILGCYWQLCNSSADSHTGHAAKWIYLLISTKWLYSV